MLLLLTASITRPYCYDLCTSNLPAFSLMSSFTWFSMEVSVTSRTVNTLKVFYVKSGSFMKHNSSTAFKQMQVTVTLITVGLPVFLFSVVSILARSSAEEGKINRRSLGRSDNKIRFSSSKKLWTCSCSFLMIFVAHLCFPSGVPQPCFHCCAFCP